MMDKNQAPAPTEGAAALSTQFTVRGWSGQTGYRSVHAATEGLEEPAQGRRIRESEEHRPRLAHHGRARDEDRLARARAARRAPRQGPPRRAPHGLWLAHRFEVAGRDQGRAR